MVESHQRLILPKVLESGLSDFRKLKDDRFIMTGEEPEIALLDKDLKLISKTKFRNLMDYLGEPIEVPGGFVVKIWKEILFFDDSLRLRSREQIPSYRDRDNGYSDALMHSSGKVITISEYGKMALYDADGSTVEVVDVEKRAGSTERKFVEINNGNLFMIRGSWGYEYDLKGRLIQRKKNFSFISSATPTSVASN